MLRIAACLYKLEKNTKCDSEIKKAYQAVRDSYKNEDEWKKHEGHEADRFRAAYNLAGLEEYKVYEEWLEKHT